MGLMITGNRFVGVMGVAISTLVSIPLLLVPISLSAQQEARAPAAGAQAPVAPGDAERGKLLFTGQVALQNGGPPCLSCHGAYGAAVLGGGNLGPDLTGAFPKYMSGLADALAHIPFPTMRPLFTRHELTEEEVGDLTAFMTGIASYSPERPEARVLVSSLLGLAGLLVLMALVWQNRLLGVRRPLLRRALREKESRNKR